MENEKDTHNEHSKLLPKQSTGSITRRNVIISDSEVEDHCFSTSVEIAILLFFFAKVLSDLLMTNFLEFVTCKNVYHYNNSVCTDPISPYIENLVQPIVANVTMVRTLTEAFFPSLFVLLVGPWSDKNGRKPFLLLSLFGLSLSYAFWGFLSVIPNIRPELFLLASIPVVLTGGPCTVFVLGYCYVCDVTTIDERVLRMAFLQFVYSIANLFGALSLPQLFKLLVHFQYTSIFFISSGLLMLAVIFVSSCLSETIIVQEDQGTKFFQLEHIEELFAVCFKERPFHGRIIVLLICVGLAITVFVNQVLSVV
uniref:Major facilitator superfamily (MFS) profile domain-containing protein n=1 Tax=Clastoptera arizonana TaxID=38151 RepID=A0A1B6CL69_9HEMI